MSVGRFYGAVCLVEGCLKLSRALGFCNAHYQKKYKYGDPLVQGGPSGAKPKHGRTHTLEYNSWMSMRRRCEYPQHHQYKNYGGRGIKVCERWRSFNNFFADMGLRPSPAHSIERRNNNGNYEPGNCVWATSKEQGSNTRTNRLVMYGGMNMTLSQCAERCNMPRTTMHSRISRWGLVDRVFTAPVQRKHPHPFS